MSLDGLIFYYRFMGYYFFVTYFDFGTLVSLWFWLWS